MCADGAGDGFKFVEMIFKTWDCKFPLHDNIEPCTQYSAPCVRFNGSQLAKMKKYIPYMSLS